MAPYISFVGILWKVEGSPILSINWPDMILEKIVKKKIVQLLRKKKSRKKEEAVFEDIREEFRENLRVQQFNDSDDEDFYMYPTNMPTNELDNYRKVLWAYKKSKWERDRLLHIERVRM